MQTSKETEKYASEFKKSTPAGFFNPKMDLCFCFIQCLNGMGEFFLHKYHKGIIVLNNTGAPSPIAFLATLEHEITHALEQYYNAYIFLREFALKSVLPESYRKVLYRELQNPTKKVIQDIVRDLSEKKTLPSREPNHATTEKRQEHEADFTAMEHIDYRYVYYWYLADNSFTRDTKYPSIIALQKHIEKFLPKNKEEKEKEKKIYERYLLDSLLFFPRYLISRGINFLKNISITQCLNCHRT